MDIQYLDSKSGAIIINPTSVEDGIIINSIYKNKLNFKLVTEGEFVGSFIANPTDVSPTSDSAIGVVNNFKFNLTDITNVLMLLGRNSKLNAVKQLKEITGLGLKDAKDVIDAWHMHMVKSFK